MLKKHTNNVKQMMAKQITDDEKKIILSGISAKISNLSRLVRGRVRFRVKV
jgi:hypothetical protein